MLVYQRVYYLYSIGGCELVKPTNIKTLSASMSVAYPPQGRIHRNYGKNYGKNYGEIHVKSGENHIDLI